MFWKEALGHEKKFRFCMSIQKGIFLSQWHRQDGTSSELFESQKIGLTFSFLAIHAHHHISFHLNQLLINISDSNRFLYQR